MTFLRWKKVSQLEWIIETVAVIIQFVMRIEQTGYRVVNGIKYTIFLVVLKFFITH